MDIAVCWFTTCLVKWLISCQKPCSINFIHFLLSESLLIPISCIPNLDLSQFVGFVYSNELMYKVAFTSNSIYSDLGIYYFPVVFLSVA